MAQNDIEVKVNESAFNRLSRARREGETLSDVIIRLSEATLEGLQRRGEMKVDCSDERTLLIEVDQDKCLGAMSCVSLAPSVFAYDSTQEGIWRKQAQPLGMKEPREGAVDSSSIILAAESCPYKAIVVKDAHTGEVEVQ